MKTGVLIVAMFLHCDREGCPSKQDTDIAMEGGTWLVVHQWADSGGDPKHFCGVDCLVTDLARFEVPETIPREHGS
jgi:hypothetical protein